jgi:hypothetical protein
MPVSPSITGACVAPSIPLGTIREVEDYTVDLNGVTVLELTIVPDLSGGNARASLISLRLE